MPSLPGRQQGRRQKSEFRVQASGVLTGVEGVGRCLPGENALHAHTHTHTHTCTHAHTCMYMLVPAHMYTHVHTQRHVCTQRHVYMCIHIDTRVHTETHVHVHTHTCTYIQTFMHTPVDTCARPCCSPSLVAKSCLTVCDPMDCSRSGFPVLHCLPEFAHACVH